MNLFFYCFYAMTNNLNNTWKTARKTHIAKQKERRNRQERRESKYFLLELWSYIYSEIMSCSTPFIFTDKESSHQAWERHSERRGHNPVRSNKAKQASSGVKQKRKNTNISRRNQITEECNRFYTQCLTEDFLMLHFTQTKCIIF